MMVRTQIQLTEDQARGLKRLAAQHGRSMADLIRTSVDRLLDQTNHNDPAARRHRALAAAGRFRSGRRDLSARHDAHLTDVFGR